MSKVSSPGPPVHSESRTNISRRTFLGMLVGGGTLAAILPNAPDDVALAIKSRKAASARFVAIEASYEALAPSLHESADTKAMRKLEDKLGSALASLRAADEAIVEGLGRAGLLGVVDGGLLYLAAELEPEGVTRLVVSPVARVRGI